MFIWVVHTFLFYWHKKNFCKRSQFGSDRLRYQLHNHRLLFAHMMQISLVRFHGRTSSSGPQHQQQPDLSHQIKGPSALGRARCELALSWFWKTRMPRLCSSASLGSTAKDGYLKIRRGEATTKNQSRVLKTISYEIKKNKIKPRKPKIESGQLRKEMYLLSIKKIA